MLLKISEYLSDDPQVFLSSLKAWVLNVLFLKL
jgi:hypothetical protein